MEWTYHDDTKGDVCETLILKGNCCLKTVLFQIPENRCLQGMFLMMAACFELLLRENIVLGDNFYAH